MATTLEIVNGISQALANKHDGARKDDGKGDLQEIGLRREEPVSIYDRRIMDGFGVNMNGNKLRVFYHGEISLKEVYEKQFEQKITDILEQCTSFLKREYKRITKDTLSLKMQGEPNVKVEHMNRMRSWVKASCIYEIGGIAEETNKRKVDDSFKKWLELGGHKGEKK